MMMMMMMMMTVLPIKILAIEVATAVARRHEALRKHRWTPVEVWRMAHLAGSVETPEAELRAVTMVPSLWVMH